MYVGPWQEYKLVQAMAQLKDENRRLTEQQLRALDPPSHRSGASLDAVTAPSLLERGTVESTRSAPMYSGSALRELLNHRQRRNASDTGVVSVRKPNLSSTGRRVGSASLEEQRRRRTQMQSLYSETPPGGGPEPPSSSSPRGPCVVNDAAGILSRSPRPSSSSSRQLNADRAQRSMLSKNVITEVLLSDSGNDVARHRSRKPMREHTAAVLGGAPFSVRDYGGQRLFDIGAPIALPRAERTAEPNPHLIEYPSVPPLHGELPSSSSGLNESQVTSPAAPLTRHRLPPSPLRVADLSAPSAPTVAAAAQVLRLRQQQEIEILLTRHRHQEQQLLLHLSSQPTAAPVPSKLNVAVVPLPAQPPLSLSPGASSQGHRQRNGDSLDLTARSGDDVGELLRWARELPDDGAALQRDVTLTNTRIDWSVTEPSPGAAIAAHRGPRSPLL